MMGTSQDEKLKGIIPRLCDSIFARIAEVGVAQITSYIIWLLYCRTRTLG